MANYSLVINSKFQPFSFERYIQPYQLYGQNYRDIENQYAELETKANIWDKLANEQTDSRAYQMYKTYANDLEKEAERLSKEGLNTSSRRNMLNMASRYSKEITPLENAYKARAEEIKEQTAGRANGIVYEGNAATSSLDRYLDNPAIKYNSANSKEGFQRVATAAAALQKKLRDYGRGKALDGFTRTWLQDHGYRDSEVYQAIHEIQGALQGDGNVRGNNVLNSILADEMNTAGVNTWGDKNARLDYFNRIAPALYQAVGQTNVGVYEDKAALMKAQEAMQIRAEKRAAARAKEEANFSDRRTRGSLPIDTINLLSPNMEGNKGSKKINKALNFFGINPKNGKAAMYRNVAIIDSGYAVSAKNKNGGNKFQIWSKDGRLLTKSQFIQQGKTQEDRRRLGLFYDRDITQNAAALGYNLGSLSSRGKVPTIRNFSYSASNINSDSSPYVMSALQVKFEDDGKILTRLLPKLTENENETVIKEVESFDKTGKVKDTGKIVEVSTFLDNEGNLKGTPNYFATPNVNTDGIFMKFNGKTYLIPRSKLGSLSNSTYNIDVPALNAAIERKNRWIDQYGEDAYYSSKEGNDNEDIIDNSGANFLRTAFNTLGWSGKAPVYDVNFDSETKIP